MTIGPARGQLMLLLDRGDQWRVGYNSIPKGGYPELHAAGLDALRSVSRRLRQTLAERVATLQDGKQLSIRPPLD
ncbi:MAG: hypothetical protein ACR2IK_13755 [Chloroflexota bacterium]